MLLSPRASQSLGTCVQRQVLSRAVLCMLLCAHTQFVKPAFSYWLCYMTHTIWDKSSSQFLFGMMNSVTKNAKVIFIFSIFMFLLIIQERNLINTRSSHLCEKSVHLGNFLHSYQVEAVLPIPVFLRAAPVEKLQVLNAALLQLSHGFQTLLLRDWLWFVQTLPFLPATHVDLGRVHGFF